MRSVNKTVCVAVRFTNEEAAAIEEAAGKAGVRAGAWLRERGLEATKGTDCRRDLLGEVQALQAITAGLFHAFARDGKLPEAKVREIVAKARGGNGKPVEL